jgi:TolB-like protein
VATPGWRGWFDGDWRLRGVGVAVLIAIAVAVGWGLRSPGPTRSGGPSLAAMPFVNVNKYSLCGQLAKGVTTDIATDFSRLRDIDAITDSVTSSLNHPDLDAPEVASDMC